MIMRWCAPACAPCSKAQADIEVVGEAEDGVVAVERCRKLEPDVVVMDLTMPGRGGIKATEDIRRECPQDQGGRADHARRRGLRAAWPGWPARRGLS